MEEKLRVVTLFSGIGAQEAALNRLGIDYEIVGYSEIDKFAIKSYEAMYGKQNALGDIEQITELPECDFITYSSPCQDFSVAGKREGLTDDSGNKTRSGLLLDVGRLLDKAKENNKLPKYLMMENVKNLVGKKFMPDFQRWLDKLSELGYNNYWKVLNAKDYGIPQNRERVFVLSILETMDDKAYKFPEPIELRKRLKDILEENVDEKYYLKGEVIDKLVEKFKNRTISNTIRVGGRGSLDGHAWDIVAVPEPKIMLEGNMYPNTGNPQVGRIYNPEGISPTLDTCNGGNRMPKVVCNDLDEPCICASRGRNPDNPSDRMVGSPTEQRLEMNSRGVCNTLTTMQKDNYVMETNYRIRRLLPLECWRLMGFSDEDFFKAQNAGVSNSQLYKQAGNSIVVDVLYYIFKNLFEK